MKNKNIFTSIFILSSVLVFGQTPILNSKPAITNKVIYLDFDGQVVSGTNWNTANGISVINALPSNLSTANKIVVWQHTSEDYFPFDVNITTDSLRFNAAPANKRIRLVITPTYSWYGNSAGGVAYVGSFTWGGTPGTPAWIFETQLGNSPKNIAEACSHEAGHTFTLRHQSTYTTLSSGTCTKTAEYNPGLGTGVTSWAPIMGVGYSKNVTIWHNGKSAVDCNTIQYDHSNGTTGITGANRLNFETDDVGNTYNSAKILNLSSINLLDSGLISTPADTDAYKFTICNNRYVSFNIKPWALDTNLNSYQGANLDIRFFLYEAITNSIVAVDTTLTRLHTLVGANLVPGSYYFTIDGGRSNNYSDYGSLGRYYIRIKATNPPAISSTIVAGSNICTNQNIPLNYTSNGVPDSWLWSVSNAVGTTTYNVQNPNVIFNAAGLYTVSLLASSTTSAGCTVTSILNVGAPPNLTVSSGISTCPYNNQTIIASGASSYVWMPGGYSGSVQVLNPGVTTVYTVTGSNGLCGNSATTAINIVSAPSISVSVSNNTVCIGESVSFTLTGANSYTLNPGGYNGNIINVTPASSTIYIITGSTGGACNNTKTKFITVVPNFTVGLSANKTDICAGENVYLTVSGANNYTITPVVASNNMYLVSPTVSTTYYALGSTDPHCVNSSEAVYVQVSACTGISELKTENMELKIYPNPALDFVSIEVSGSTKLEVITTLGGIIVSKKINNTSTLLLNTENWAKGVYFVKAISDTKKQVVQKLIIE